MTRDSLKAWLDSQDFSDMLEDVLWSAAPWDTTVAALKAAILEKASVALQAAQEEIVQWQQMYESSTDERDNRD
jgi:hypothetical protein